MSEKKFRSVKWSGDDIAVFLELYNKNYELLWNIRHADYANKAKRESALGKLKGELIRNEIAVPDLTFLRARIKSIKSTYRAELIKIIESNKSGTEDIYVPKLPWYDAADVFLRHVIKTRYTSDLITPETQATDSYEDMYETYLLNENNEGSNTTPLNPELVTSIPRKRRHTKLDRVEGVVGKLQKITESQAATVSKENGDESELFGKFIAMQLRDLPKINRLKLQQKIQSMLTSERLQLLQSQVTSTNHTGQTRTPSPMVSRASSSISNYCLSEEDEDYNLEDEVDIKYGVVS